MAFKKKTWVDRMVEYAGRRKITNVTTMAAQIVDVERAEGVVSEEGTAINAVNMNDLEQRTADAFSAVQQDIEGINSDLGGYQFDTIDGVPSFKAGADAVWVPLGSPEVYYAQYSFPANQGTITFTPKKACLWLMTNGDWFSSQYQAQLKLQINDITVPFASFKKYNNCYIAKYDTKQYINSAASLVVDRTYVAANAYNYIILLGV